MWLLVGLVAWTFFLIAINIAIPTLLGTGPLLQKIYFPAFAPVLGAISAVLVQTLIEFGILAVILLIFGDVGPTWLLFPVWLCLFVLFVNGIATSLAILNVYSRDIAHITAVALQLLFFLTPIIYPITLVPEDWHGIPLRAIVQANPLACSSRPSRARLRAEVPEPVLLGPDAPLGPRLGVGRGVRLPAPGAGHG